MSSKKKSSIKKVQKDKSDTDDETMDESNNDETMNESNNDETTDEDSNDATNESTTDEDNNESINEDNVEEYYYDLEEIKNKSSPNCIKCDRKCTSVHQLAVCRSCLKDLAITKTIAMKTYNFKKQELDDIDHYSYKNTHGGYTHLYLLKEIRLLAIRKRFNKINPNINTYMNCLNILQKENLERKKISRDKTKKMLETRKKNRKLKEKQIELERKIRRKELTSKLAKKGLELRNDSVCCNKYINGDDELSLNEVVDIMITMNFFATKTDYFKLIKQRRQEYAQNNRDAYDYGCERQYIDESDKEECKIKAFEKYIKSKKPINKIPAIVYENYFPYCNE